MLKRIVVPAALFALVAAPAFAATTTAPKTDAKAKPAAAAPAPAKTPPKSVKHTKHAAPKKS